MREAKELANFFPVIIDVMKKNSNNMMSCEKEGLTHIDLRILFNLYIGPEKIAMKDLATALGVTRGTLTTTIKRVINKKYCKREKSLEDARQTYISLTPKGRRLVDKEKENLEKNFETLFNKMNLQERKKVFNAYKSIYEILKKFQG